MLRTVICVYQGASPFGGTKSRCVIFWLVHPCHLYLPRCLTFRHHPVKMPHLWTGSSLINCHLCLPRCLTFRRHPVKMVSSLGWFIPYQLSSVFAKVSHLSAASSQDASSLGWFIPYQLSSVFAKVSHLSAAPSPDASSLGWFIPYQLSSVFAKVSHLSAAPSQDASSLGWFIPYQLSSVFAKVSHLSAAPSQDASSLGWFIPYQLSSVFAKVSHLSAAHSIFRLFPHMCVNVCIYKFLDILMEFVGPQASCIYCHLPVCVCVYYNHLSVCFDPTR